MAELGIKGLLEYQVTALVSLLLIYMIPIDCKIKNFPYTCSLSIMLSFENPSDKALLIFRLMPSAGYRLAVHVGAYLQLLS